MKQAVLVASVGASVPEARISIAAAERALTEAAPDWRFVRSFTSPAIRRKLADRGEQIPGVTEALEQLRAEGVRRVIVQPTHLLYGCEYDKLRAETGGLSRDFETLAIGRPLLADNADLLRFAQELSASCPAEDRHAAVFIGHGTGHFANAAYPAMQTALRLMGREDIYIGTVKGWPELGDILRQLEARGPRRVRLLPLMLAAGDHARNDMAGKWKERLEQSGYTGSCSFTGLGEYAWVQEMYQERLKDVMREIG